MNDARRVEGRGDASVTGMNGAGKTADRPDKRRSGLGRLAGLAHYVLRYKAMAGIALIALIIAAGSNLAAIGALKPMIDKGFGGSDPEAIDGYFLLLFGIVILLAVSSSVRAYYVTLLGERVAADLRRAVYDRLIQLTPSWYEENRPSEIASRLTADASLIQQVVSTSVSIALRNSALFLGSVAMMIAIDPRLMAMISLAIPLVVLPIVHMGRKVRALSRSSQDRIADVGAQAAESLGAIAIVQAFTREAEEQKRFGRIVEAAYGTARRRILTRATMGGVVIFLVTSAIILVLWQGAKAVIEGEMSGGDMAAFIGYAIMAAGASGAVIEVYGDLQRAAGAAARLSDLLAARPSIPIAAHPVPLPEPARGEVRFESVSFAYPSRPDIAALQDIDLHIAPGETVALVGPSGAGKSTLLQLLLRFFDPDSGRVLLDGVDIRDVDLKALRTRIAIVPQETVLFADTVRENIRFGRPDADDAAVEAAARAAIADGFIRSLPDGYDSWLGERGVRLSGGQRQRIAIARAVLRDAPILLLDEATSALDSESERLVQAALERLMEGRTSILIAHRLATVLKADRILVMDEGTIKAEGRHEELIASSPLYARLAALQFETGNLSAG